MSNKGNGAPRCERYLSEISVAFRKNQMSIGLEIIFRVRSAVQISAKYDCEGHIQAGGGGPVDMDIGEITGRTSWKPLTQPKDKGSHRHFERRNAATTPGDSIRTEAATTTTPEDDRSHQQCMFLPASSLCRALVRPGSFTCLHLYFVCLLSCSLVLTEAFRSMFARCCQGVFFLEASGEEWGSFLHPLKGRSLFVASEHEAVQSKNHLFSACDVQDKWQFYMSFLRDFFNWGVLPIFVSPHPSKTCKIGLHNTMVHRDWCHEPPDMERSTSVKSPGKDCELHEKARKTKEG